MQFGSFEKCGLRKRKKKAVGRLALEFAAVATGFCRFVGFDADTVPVKWLSPDVAAVEVESIAVGLEDAAFHVRVLFIGLEYVSSPFMVDSAA